MLCVNLLTSLVWPSVYSVFMIIFIYLCTDRPGFPRPSQPPPSSSSSLVASCARISPCDLSSSSFLFFSWWLQFEGQRKCFDCEILFMLLLLLLSSSSFFFFFKFRGTLKVDAGVMTFKWPLCHSNRWCNTTGSCFPASPLHHQQSQHIQQEQLHRSSLLPSGETLPPAATSRPLWPSQRWVPFSSNFSLCVAYLPSRTRCVCGWDTLGGSELQPELELCHAAPQPAPRLDFSGRLCGSHEVCLHAFHPHTHTAPTSCLVFDNVTQKCAAVSVTPDSPPPRTHSIARLHSSLLFLCLHGWKPKTCTVNFTMFKRSEYSSWSNWLYVKWTLY